MSPSMYSVNFGSNKFAGTIAPAPIPRSAARKYCRMLLPVRAAPAAEVRARATEAAAMPTLLQAIGVTTEVAIVGAVQKLWITGGTGGVPEIAHTWNFSSDRFLPEPAGVPQSELRGGRGGRAHDVAGGDGGGPGRQDEREDVPPRGLFVVAPLPVSHNDAAHAGGAGRSDGSV